MRRRVTGLLKWIAKRELALLAMVSPVLLLSELDRCLAMASLIVVVLLGLVHLLSRGKLTVGVQIDVPVAILAVMLMVSMSVSADWSLSFPKFCVIVLSIAVLYALLHNMRTRAQIEVAFWMLALMGLVVAILSLLSTDWFESKIFSSGIYGALPRLIDNVPRSSRGGFHPNEVAGALIMFVPLYVSLLLASHHQHTDCDEPAIGGPTGFSEALLSVLHRVATPLLAMGLALIALTILLTQSRAAVLALAIALVAMAATRRRVILLVLPVAFALGLIWIRGLQGGTEPSLSASGLLLPGGALAELVTAADSATVVARENETTSWLARTEMWANALQACRDYPYTGAGLANFPAVSRANYIYEQLSLQFNMAHAHNLYLQTAMDFGIPGLLAFLWLVLYMILSLGHVLRHSSEERAHWLGTGLLGGVLSYVAFGLFDAVPLGAKPSVAFWALAALSIALARQLGHRGVVWPASWHVRLTRGHSLVFALLVMLGAVLLSDVALHTFLLNLGAVRLDKAQLETGLTTQDRQGLLNAAEHALGKAVAYGDSVGIHRRLGVIYAALGRDEQAVLEWQQDGAADRFLRQQGHWSLLKGDPLAAARYFELAISLDPASVASYYDLGLLHEHKGRQEEALTVYDKALEAGTALTDPAFVGLIHYRRAGIFSDQGKWPEALEDYSEAVRISSGVASYRIGLARALYKVKQDVAGAEEQLQMAMELSPTYHWSYTFLSGIYRSEGRYAEALQAADVAAGLAPQDPWPLVFRGEVHMTTEAYESAIRDFEQAVSLDAEQPHPHFLLGRAYWAVGRREEAIQEYETATELTPGVEYLERALERARQEMASPAPGEGVDNQ